MTFNKDKWVYASVILINEVNMDCYVAMPCNLIINNSCNSNKGYEIVPAINLKTMKSINFPVYDKNEKCLNSIYVEKIFTDYLNACINANMANSALLINLIKDNPGKDVRKLELKLNDVSSYYRDIVESICFDNSKTNTVR